MSPRDERLLRLRAFGLFVHGGRTFYEIADALGIVEVNPATAAGRARTRVIQGWKIVREHRVRRWERFYVGAYTTMGWEAVRGARLSTHPRVLPTPPPKESTPFDHLLARIEGVEREAVSLGFPLAATGLHNLRVALRYNQREAEQKAARG